MGRRGFAGAEEGSDDAVHNDGVDNFARLDEGSVGIPDGVAVPAQAMVVDYTNPSEAVEAKVAGSHLL